MKKFITFCLAAASFVSLYAQEDAQKAVQEAAEAMTDKPAEVKAPEREKSCWTNSNKFDIGLSQVGLFNWAAGGNNTVALRTALDVHMDYAKDLMSWKNRLQLEYGFLYSSDKPWPLIEKNSDLIYFESKWAYQTAKESKWKYAASFDFRSQFAPGYDYSNTPAKPAGAPDDWKAGIEDWKRTRILKSDITSPAYTNLALGIDWNPTSWLDINLSPLTGGFTIVSNPLLRKDYGMDLFKGVDPATATGIDYKPAKFQFGAQMKTNIKFVVNKVFLFESQLVLFTDYLSEPYIRVNWDNKIEWQIHKLFKLGVYTWLIYDPWVMNNGAPRGVQFKESVTLNFTYSISPTIWKRQKKS